VLGSRPRSRAGFCVGRLVSMSPARTPLEWTDLDKRAVDTARCLAMDAVQKVGNGHPGTAMSLAPVAYLLFQKRMRHDPADPTWSNRDRFVLSCGHSSITLYTQLYLGGYGLELDDLKALRTWGSLTPGHPEHGHTAGVETTTGPLGQGVANSVGMALAARREKGMFDPENTTGDGPFDHHIYTICSDGDLEEGVSAEASSIAGHQKLGNLTVIYDANRISIEGDTHIAFTEDVAKRYEAYGWHVQHVDWTHDGDHADGAGYYEDVPALWAALDAAEDVTDQPSLIVLNTIIAWPAPKAQNTEAAHGSALGADEIAATKKVLGFDPEQTFEVPAEVIEHTRGLLARGAAAGAAWDEQYTDWAAANPEREALLHRLKTRALPDGWDADLPSYPADAKGVATRVASGEFINAVAPHLPELWGGSADLAGSNNTTIKGAPSVTPDEWQTSYWSGNPYGRVLHFGIREHAMGSIMNGVTLHGGTRIFGGTFLVFSDYMRPSVRLAALMKLPTIYVWTHDSIGLGEDGPSADRARRRPPGDPGSGRCPSGRRQRDRSCLGGDLGADRPTRRVGSEPAEPADLSPRRAGLRQHRGRCQGRVCAARHRRDARRDPDRHRVRGPARRDRTRTARGQGNRGPGGLDAVPRVVRRPRPELPRLGAASHGEGPGKRRSRHRSGLA
jgi:transketolase